MAIEATDRRSNSFEIEVEKRETVILRYRREIVSASCEYCGPGSQLLAPEDAARSVGMTLRAVFVQIEEGKAHFIEENGEIRVCRHSLED